MASFGERIKELRTEKGMRQKDLAEKIGVSKAAVSLWERGVTRPDFYAVEKLCNLFDTTMAYLMGSDEGRYAVHISDEELNILAIEDETERLEQIVSGFLRLSEKSQRIITASIMQAMKEETGSGDLMPGEGLEVEIRLKR